MKSQPMRTREELAEVFGCRNWKEFGSARKLTDETGLTYDEARRRCAALNAELSPAQKRRGTMYEFTAE